METYNLLHEVCVQVWNLCKLIKFELGSFSYYLVDLMYLRTDWLTARIHLRLSYVTISGNIVNHFVFEVPKWLIDWLKLVNVIRFFQRT